MLPRHRSLALTVGLLFLGGIAEVTTEQPSGKTAPPARDGLVGSELSLAAHTATVAFAPALRAGDSANRSLFISSPGSSTARVRVAQLETNGSLRMGTLALGKDDPAGLRYELWLEGTPERWQLQVTNLPKPATADPRSVVGHVALSRRAGAVVSPTFAAALMPVTGDTGRLVLLWGEYEADAEVQFTDPPRRRQTENARPNVPTNRTHDEDTSALSRARLLAQRNETALVVPKGARLSVSFARSFARPERSAAGAAATSVGLGVDGPDFARLMSTADGAIVQLTESAVPRLRIEAPLRFGKTTVRTGNQGPGFPGSYGIWLKRVGNGWRLVLNDEADAWGSQHDPKFDAAEIALTHSEGHPASRPFAVALVPTGADRGRLLILWGPHEWTADFVVAG